MVQVINGFRIICIFILLSVMAPLHANNTVVDTVLVLQEVVVTGSGKERPVTQNPGNIGVITPLILRNSPAQSIDDILSMISGVNTTRSDGLSNIHSNVSVRGLSGDEQGAYFGTF